MHMPGGLFAFLVSFACVASIGRVAAAAASADPNTNSDLLRHADFGSRTVGPSWKQFRDAAAASRSSL